MTTSYVLVHYGPCESFNTLCHKPQKLKGLRDRLRKMNYRVELRPVEHLNLCVLEMCGHEIFRCNINNLKFNLPFHQDPVARRAVDAVLEATEKLNNARKYLFLWTTIEDQLFKRNNLYAPKDYFPFSINIQPYTMECVNCCGILVAKKSDRELRELDVEDEQIIKTKEFISED